jgi:hypothetical protein
MRLVSNGCSYLYGYWEGGGTRDLASTLGCNEYDSLARTGVSNQSIIRTTFEDVFTTTSETLYIIGTTFHPRFEIPVGENNDWISPINIDLDTEEFPNGVTRHDVMDYIDARNRVINDRALKQNTLWLFSQVTMLLDTIRYRGHKAIVFNTAENRIANFIDRYGKQHLEQFDRPEIVELLTWQSNKYQFDNGAKWDPADNWIEERNCRHPDNGEHQHLNNFLVDYINKHCII